MATIGDGFKDIFLAGVGALAIGAEKSKELVDQLISKGELTVDQGKEINTELKHKAEAAATQVRDDLLEAHMSVMTPEDRLSFAAKAAELAAKANAQAEGADSSEAAPEATGAEVEVEPEQAGEPEAADKNASE